MQPKTRAVVIGVGAVGRLIARTLHQKGVPAVGAFNANPSIIGADLGVLCGFESASSSSVSGDLEAVLSLGPDVAIIAAASYLDEIEPLATACARSGTDVLTTAEEALFPWRTAPDCARRLDEAFRRHDVSFAGSGFQDFFWVNSVLQLMGTCHSVGALHAQVVVDIGDSGPAVLDSRFVGERPETARRLIANGLRGLAPFRCFQTSSARIEVWRCWLSMRDRSWSWLRFRSSARRRRRSSTSVLCRASALTCRSLRATAWHLIYVWSRRSWAPDEQQECSWQLHGRPDVGMSFRDPAIDLITAATLVHRIPHARAASPGICTVNHFPPLRGWTPGGSI